MTLIPPTLQEIELQAAKIGLPEVEAHKFYFYFDSNGWRVGKNKMQRWTSALTGWKLRWQERNGPANGATNHAAPLHRDERF